MRMFLLLSLLGIPFLSFAQQDHRIQEFSIDKESKAKMILKGSPDFLAVDGNEIWVLNIDRVEKLSSKYMKPILSVPIKGACGAMIVGSGSLWVASCSEKAIYRINHKSGKIQSVIPCHISDKNGEIMLAFGDHSLWVLSDSIGFITRISAESNQIQASIKVLPGSHCAVYGFKSVWITNTLNNSVQRIDPKTNTVITTIPVESTPRFLTAGENGVWTLNQGDGTVSHIDPNQNKVIGVVDTSVPGTGGDIAAGIGYIWVRAKNGRLLQAINPVSNQVERVYTPLSGSGAVRVAGHKVWVTSHDIQTIWALEN